MTIYRRSLHDLVRSRFLQSRGVSYFRLFGHLMGRPYTPSMASRGLGFLSAPLLRLFRSHGAQLEGMDAVFLGQLVLKQRVDEPVPSRLHFRLEGVGGDDESEVCLGRRDPLHRLVVGMEMRVVVNLERGWLKGRGELAWHIVSHVGFPKESNKIPFLPFV